MASEYELNASLNWPEERSSLAWARICSVVMELSARAAEISTATADPTKRNFIAADESGTVGQ